MYIYIYIYVCIYLYIYIYIKFIINRGNRFAYTRFHFPTLILVLR